MREPGPDTDQVCALIGRGRDAESLRAQSARRRREETGHGGPGGLHRREFGQHPRRERGQRASTIAATNMFAGEATQEVEVNREGRGRRQAGLVSRRRG